MSEFGFNMAASVAASIVFVLCAWFWAHRLRPWLDDRAYKGLRVDGTWILKQDGGQPGDDWKQTEKMILSQTADRVFGELDLTPKQNSGAVAGRLRIEGTVADGFLSVLMWSTDQSAMSHACVLGRLIGSGSELKGYTIYYDIDTSKIRSEEVSYHKE